MKKMYLVISSILIAIAVLVTVNLTNTKTLAADGPRDCNNNSIIYCGALSQGELLGKFDQNSTGDLPAIYSHYGIARSDIAGATSEVKMGRAFRDGRIEVDGRVVATNAQSLGRGNAAGSHPLQINGRTYYESPSSTIFLSDSISAYVLMRNGQFYSAVLASCANPMVATPKPQPIYSCDALKANKISRTEYDFTTATTAINGAAVAGYSYDFGDGSTANSATPNVHHAYQKAGSYTVKVAVQINVNGGVQTVTGPQCQTVVVVEEQPPTPVYTCNSLSARVISLQDRSYEYKLAYTAEGGAKLASVDYDFGDQQKVTVNGTADQTVNHSYDKAGSYKTTATLHFTVNENGVPATKDVNCEVAISISPEMCALIPSLPKDSPECQPVTPPVAPVVPAPPAPPAELPHTGLDNVLGGGLGIGSLTAAAYYWQDSRRNLASKLFNR